MGGFALTNNHEFQLIYSQKVQKQLPKLSAQFQRQYHNAFERLQCYGPKYHSLRTHRYHRQGKPLWGSSASMFLRFYWHYAETLTICVVLLDSH